MQPTTAGDARRPQCLAVLLATCALASSGCNVARWKADQLTDDFHDAGLTLRSATLGEQKLVWWDGGSGAPVLLLEGYGPNALFHWSEQVGPLGVDHRLIVPDLIFCGDSTSTLKRVGIRRQAEAMIELLDHLGIERIDVIGFSYGGFVAWALAGLYPERVGRLVLIDCPGTTYTAADYRALLERLEVAHGADLFVPSDADDVQRLLGLAYRDPPWAPAFARKQVVSELYGRNRDEMRALMDAAFEEMAESQSIPDPIAPSLVIWGLGDPVFPVELSQRVLSRLGSNATLELVSGTHHAPNLERPDRVNPLLRRFIASWPQ